jgi:hypothetical protein
MQCGLPLVVHGCQTTLMDANKCTILRVRPLFRRYVSAGTAARVGVRHHRAKHCGWSASRTLHPGTLLRKVSIYCFFAVGQVQDREDLIHACHNTRTQTLHAIAAPSAVHPRSRHSRQHVKLGSPLHVVCSMLLFRCPCPNCSSFFLTCERVQVQASAATTEDVRPGLDTAYAVHICSACVMTAGR